MKRIALFAIALTCVGCASTGAVPRPFPLPVGAGNTPGSHGAAGTPEAAVPAPTFDGYALVGTALALRGAPYRSGGTNPQGFDCSGFTQYVFAQYGIALPREVREQFKAGRSVDPRKIEPGDLIFFTTTEPGASHVGIAVGGDEFVHAPSSTGVVRVERMGSSYWSRRVVGARHVTPP